MPCRPPATPRPPAKKDARPVQSQRQSRAAGQPTPGVLSISPHVPGPRGRHLLNSVPVSWARMWKERDWVVPVRGCQSSVSSISRFLLESLGRPTGGLISRRACLCADRRAGRSASAHGTPHITQDREGLPAKPRVSLPHGNPQQGLGHPTPRGTAPPTHHADTSHIPVRASLLAWQPADTFPWGKQLRAQEHNSTTCQLATDTDSPLPLPRPYSSST